MKIVKPEVNVCNRTAAVVAMIFCPECMVTVPRVGGAVINYCPNCGSRFKYDRGDENDEHGT